MSTVALPILLVLSAILNRVDAGALVRTERQHHIIASVTATGVDVRDPHVSGWTDGSEPRMIERYRRNNTGVGGLRGNMPSAESPHCAADTPRVYMYRLPAELRGDLDICKEAATDTSVEFPGGLLQGSTDASAPFPSAQGSHGCWDHTNFLFELKLWSDLHGMNMTNNPEDADLFLVPAFLVEMYLHNRRGRHCDFCKRRDSAIVDFLRSIGPYWDRFSGTDHLVTSLRCTKLPSSTHFDDAFPNMWGHTMRACLEEVARPRAYDLRSTIKVPYFIPPVSGNVRPPSMRNTSVFFTGSMMPSRLWMQDAFPLVASSNLEWFERRSSGELAAVENLLERMSMSKFVVVPPGDTPESMRFMQAIHVGAIPVVVSDDVRYPFEDVIPWSDFVIRIPEASVHADPNLLNHTVTAKSDAELGLMQQNMIEARASLTYGTEAGAVADLVIRSACHRLMT
mmetsp:Transcript_9432/g.26588  ORF Transcript_9432/g.26588 Transcript_9432/m.26588 type:complete len:454 (+) Transcript_9432:54-1415(+)